MTQELIVQNDEEADYVQFTVEIPDGYKEFSISTINGTMINQNYLNIGDSINFKFSNNPITYNNRMGVKIADYTDETTLKEEPVDDETPYQYLKLDLFNYYRIKFVPIYSYYSINQVDSCYVFNPADKDELLDEPKPYIKDYRIDKDEDGNITCPFTGQYVITLEHVDKLPDINVVIGESIGNSKTQPSDVSLNEAGEIIGDNQQTATYSYGSKWRYDVSNLLMNHCMTINKGQPLIEDYYHLCYYVKSSRDNSLYSSPVYKLFNNTIINKTYRPFDIPGSLTYYFFTYDVDNQTFSELNKKLSLTLTEPLTRIVLEVVNTDYKEIEYDYSVDKQGGHGEIPGGCKIIGTDLKDNSKYKIAVINGDNTVNIVDMNDDDYGFPIKDDVYYTGSKFEIHAFAVNGVSLKNKTLSFNNFNQYQLIICDQRTPINCHIVEDNVDVDVVFCKYDNQNIRSSNIKVIVGETIELDKYQKYLFINTINIGYVNYDVLTYKPTIVESNEEEEEEEEEPDYNKMLSYPLQLTSFNGANCIPADDDLLVKHIKDDNNIHGLLIHNNKLTNRMYYSLNIEGTNKYRTSTKMMTGANDVEPLVFIPKKSNIILLPFNVDNITPVDGLMKICDINGDTMTTLVDSNCSLFLANGHETLNVDSPKSDDYKFKTFNGSLTFDRSMAKITRLFSMTNSNSCIGYINDILAARLSRYYFTANYSIFNIFFNQSGNTPFSNSLNQSEAIYSNFKNYIYTGCHEIMLANCGDIVKLIGCDVIVNNCMPGITNEEHIIDVDELVDLNSFGLLYDINIQPYYYKLFHYYNSGFNHSPSIGGSNNLTNGISLTHVHNRLFNELDENNDYTNAPDIVISDCVYISNKERVENTINNYVHVSDDITDWFDNLVKHKNNSVVELTYTEDEKDIDCGGFINVLPVPRVYRNNNFEQSDLTISTGRIKTLSPIYIQSVNRITLNNLLYMFDMMINDIVNKYGEIKNDDNMFDWLLVFKHGTQQLAVNEECVLRRFGMSRDDAINGYIPTSFDSSFIMNYLIHQRVNEYKNDVELNESLPIINNELNNEEIIWDIITNKPETNIQLFSSRYFNFHENISPLSEIVWVQVINNSLELGNNNCSMYFGKYKGASVDDNDYVVMKNYIDNFYSNVLINNNYNIVRTINTMISKLGEFLDFPKIVFGSTLSFNTSKIVNIQYLNPTKYVNEFTTKYKVNQETNITTFEEDYKSNIKQKNNIAMFGVVFKYHQLSLGWQQMINDIQDTFTISQARGQKHFVVKIYDEFGRQIPNVDTSQGFKNNLRLEISLIA